MKPPRCGTCELADGVGLPVVLAQVGVHEIHHVGPDGRLEHRRQRHVLARGLPLLGVHGDQRPSASLGEHGPSQYEESEFLVFKFLQVLLRTKESSAQQCQHDDSRQLSLSTG